jgi:EmrB/QacA subfamily drug resistance transporter
MSAYLIFILTCSAVLLSGTSNTAISVAFPQIQESFNTSLVYAGWILSIYSLTAIPSMVLIGKIGDVFGRKRIFLVCMSFFITGSLLAAIAPNIWLEVLARAIQAIGGGGLNPSVMAVIADQFPDNRQKAIGLGMSLFPIGNIIGPNLGSWLLSTFGWRSIFWMNVPIGLLIAVVIFFIMPSKKGQSGHIDFIGAGILTASLFSLILGISQFGIKHNSLVSWLPTGLLLSAAVIFIVIFLRFENRAKKPIIDMEVIKGRYFFATNAFTLIYGATVIGIASFLPLFAVSVYGMSTFESGLVITARAIVMILGSAVASFFILRWGYRRPLITGTLMIVVAYALFGFEPSHVQIFGLRISNQIVLIIIASLAGMGMGIIGPAANNACIDLMPERVGTITGVRHMFRQTGSSISISFATVILESFKNISQGFQVTFLGVAALMLIALPFIFNMPERANSSP